MESMEQIYFFDNQLISERITKYTHTKYMLAIHAHYPLNNNELILTN